MFQKTFNVTSVLPIMHVYVLVGLIMVVRHGLCNTCSSVSGVKGKCSPQHAYLKIHGIGISACQKECSNRLRCAAINYKFDTFTCELLHSTNVSLSYAPQCAYMVKGQWQRDLELCRSCLCDVDTRCLSVGNIKALCVTQDDQFLPTNLLQIRNLDLGECFGISSNDSSELGLQPCSTATVWSFIYKTDLPAFVIKYNGKCLKLPQDCEDETEALQCVQFTACSVYDTYHWTPVRFNNGSVQLQNVQQPSWCLCYVENFGIYACNCSDTVSSRHLKWFLKYQLID